MSFEEIVNATWLSFTFDGVEYWPTERNGDGYCGFPPTFIGLKDEKTGRKLVELDGMAVYKIRKTKSEVAA